MTETSFPLTNNDFTNAQWTHIFSALGDGIIDDGGQPFTLTLNASTDTGTLSLSSVSGAVNRAVVGGFGYQTDAALTVSLPPVSATTVYQVGLFYDPTNAAHPVTSQVRTGALNLTGDQAFLPLYSVTRAPNSSLSAATVADLRGWFRPSIEQFWPIILIANETITSDSYLVQTGTRVHLHLGMRKSSNGGWKAGGTICNIPAAVAPSGTVSVSASLTSNAALGTANVYINPDGSIVISGYITNTNSTAILLDADWSLSTSPANIS